MRSVLYRGNVAEGSAIQEVREQGKEEAKEGQKGQLQGPAPGEE